jgi:hypothetical protein
MLLQLKIFMNLNNLSSIGIVVQIDVIPHMIWKKTIINIIAASIIIIINKKPEPKKS